MKIRSVIAVAVLPIVVAAIWLSLRPDPQVPTTNHQSRITSHPSPTLDSRLPAPESQLPTPEPLPSGEARIDLADDLDKPGGTIRRDIESLNAVFAAWQTNFPHEGNPVGENAEITAALVGRNRLELALIPANHRAINARGELVDRWGTPFRFHQVSGSRMDITSAGPDRRFATGDDVANR